MNYAGILFVNLYLNKLNCIILVAHYFYFLFCNASHFLVIFNLVAIFAPSFMTTRHAQLDANKLSMCTLVPDQPNALHFWHQMNLALDQLDRLLIYWMPDKLGAEQTRCQ